MEHVLLTQNWQDVVGATGDTLIQSQDNELIEIIVSDTTPTDDAKGLSVMPKEKLNLNVSSKLWARTLSGTGYLIFYSSAENNGGGDTSMENVTSSWETSFSSSTGTGTTVVIGTAYTDITGLIGSFIQTAQGPSPITYDTIKNRFHCSKSTTDYYSFSLIWRLSGTVGASVNQTSEFLIEIRRGDGVTVLPAKRVFSKFSGGAVTLTNEAVADIKIRVFAGGTDPFQDNVTATGGFKVFVRKLSGNDLTLNFNDTTSPKVANTFLFVR